MSGSTINTTITHGVTLGSPGYLSPLTVTSTGGIAPSATGATALYADLGAGYVLNQGGIAGATGGTGGGGLGIGGAPGDTGGTGGSGVNLAGSSLINDGSIAGGTGGIGGIGGIAIGGPGGMGGMGGSGGIGVDVTGGSLTNYGTITGGSSGFGGSGGSGNGEGATGVPGFGGIGVRLESGGTLTDAGLIRGGAGIAGLADAVYFGNGAARLILDPGASFDGSVVANAAFSNVLELASGASAGTLSGLGSQFTGFANVTIDAGASWTLVSAQVGPADTITDAGTLTNPGYLSGVGVTVVTGGSLINPGTIAGSAGGSGGAGGSSVDLAGGKLTNNGTIAGGVGGFSSDVGGAGGLAIGVDAAGGSLTNDGKIAGGGAGNGTNGGGRGGDGVNLAGDSLTNASGATITGGYGGNAGAGAQSGDGGNGVDVAGGSVTNALGATIAGGNGGLFEAGGTGGNGGNGVNLAGGSLVNDGMIAGGTSGAYFFGGASGTGGEGVYLTDGSLTNASGGTIAGGYGAAGGIGVLFQSGGTLTDAGLIAGGAGIGSAADAVYFGSGIARLIVDPGASFSGDAVANVQYNNLLELGSAGSAGTIVGLGSAITGFGTVQFDANAAWLVEGDSAGLATGQTIDDFASGDTIELTGFVATGRTFVGAGLIVSGSGGSELIGIQGNFVTADFTVTNDGSDSFIELNPRCFLRGTHILTDHGEVAVEGLAVGDRVVTRSGEVMPIAWIGHRRIDCRNHPEPRKVWPVCVRAGAFGDGTPHRDLLMSPDHAVFVDEVLIPIKCLINGASIEQVPMDQVRYYHVELQHHDVLLAEGLPAESYLDTGDRFNFANGGGPIALHPEFSPRRLDTALVWDALGCAPLIVTGDALETVRLRVNVRVAAVATAALGGQSEARAAHAAGHGINSLIALPDQIAR